MSRPSSRAITARPSSARSNFSGTTFHDDPNQPLRRSTSTASIHRQGLPVTSEAVSRLHTCLKNVNELQVKVKSRAEKQKPRSSLGGVLGSLASTASAGMVRGRAANVHPSNHLFSLYKLEEDIQQALALYKHRELFPVGAINRDSEAASAAAQFEVRVNEMTTKLQAAALPEPGSFGVEQLQQVLERQASRVWRAILFQYKYPDITQNQQAHTKEVLKQHMNMADADSDAWQNEQIGAKITQDNSPEFLKYYERMKRYQSEQASHATAILANLHSDNRLNGVLESDCKACKVVRRRLGAMLFAEARSSNVAPAASGRA